MLIPSTEWNTNFPVGVYKGANDNNTYEQHNDSNKLVSLSEWYKQDGS
jgi:hypothetical protein